MIYINEAQSQKVMRWKIAIQEYMFDIEHIPGVKNMVVDDFSRFCAFPARDSDQQESSKEQEQVEKSDTFH